MPEQDRFEKALRAGWRTAYQYVTDGTASPEEIDDKLVQSLARELREKNGVPGFQAIEHIVAASSAAPVTECFSVLDDIVRDQEGHRHTKIAAKVAKSLLAQEFAGGDVAHRFSEDVCSALVEHYFFARARPRLVTEGKFVDHEEVRRWQAQVENAMQPAIQKIAAQLVGDPDAKGLRTPRRAARKVSTSDLLTENLVSMNRSVAFLPNR